MIEVFDVVLVFLRTDIFVPFGLLTVPFLIGRKISKLKERFLNIDEVACRFIIFSGLAYIGIILLYWIYLFLFISDSHPEYAATTRATGPYAWAYWVFPFSWLFLTQSFRFKLVRKNILIRIILIPFFLFTFNQYVILTINIHRDYLPPGKSSFNLKSILDVIPFWSLHVFLKLALFIGYVFLFQWIYQKIKKNKVVS